jgi:5-(carboxyamino)imidazole ribonucleotide mutase
MGMTTPLVGVVMGSDSDWPVMQAAAKALDEFGVPFEADVISAHRMPHDMIAYGSEAAGRGLRVIIAGAGGAAHLAGAMAAHTTLPVIGVPLDSSPLGGFDALLATVQMPPGVPVAAVGVGAMGAKNAAHLAVSILALQDDALRIRLQQRRRRMAEEIVGKAATLRGRLRKLLGGT